MAITWRIEDADGVTAVITASSDQRLDPARSDEDDREDRTVEVATIVAGAGSSVLLPGLVAQVGY